MPSGLFCANSLYTATGSFSLLFVANIFGAFIQSYITPARIVMFLNSVLEDRNGGYCLAKESWEALLDLTFQEDLCCTGPSFPLLLQVQTHLACCLSLVSWAVFAWSAAFCEFSQTLNCWWYQLDSFSVWGIVQNWQSYLAVMWARNECHLWFRNKDDSDSLSDWQWVRTRSAIHWVEQEVFLQRFWALPPFEGRLLAGLRFCQFCTHVFVFLLIYEVIYYSFKENKSWHLCFHFVFTESRALVALYCEVLSFVSLIGRTMYFHSRSLFWLVCCIFRTNFTRAFFHV